VSGEPIEITLAADASGAMAAGPTWLTEQQSKGLSCGRERGMSYCLIASELSRAGLKPRSGGLWNPNQIRRIAQKCGVV
jgi:hypothetical protein